MWDPASIDPRILWWYLWDHDQVPGNTCIATAGEVIWMRAIQVTHYLLTLLSSDMALLTSDSLSKIYRYLDLGDVEPMEPEAVFWRDERVVRLTSVGGEVWEAALASFGLTLASGKLNGDFCSALQQLITYYVDDQDNLSSEPEVCAQKLHRFCYLGWVTNIFGEHSELIFLRILPFVLFFMNHLAPPLWLKVVKQMGDINSEAFYPVYRDTMQEQSLAILQHQFKEVWRWLTGVVARSLRISVREMDKGDIFRLEVLSTLVWSCDFRLPFPEMDRTLHESITRADSETPWALSFLSSASRFRIGNMDAVSTPS